MPVIVYEESNRFNGSSFEYITFFDCTYCVKDLFDPVHKQYFNEHLINPDAYNAIYKWDIDVALFVWHSIFSRGCVSTYSANAHKLDFDLTLFCAAVEVKSLEIRSIKHGSH